MAHFNSRPSARGDAHAAVAQAPSAHFNSRPSARGDMTRISLKSAQNISIHAPPRGATHSSVS